MTSITVKIDCSLNLLKVTGAGAIGLELMLLDLKTLHRLDCSRRVGTLSLAIAELEQS